MIIGWQELLAHTKKTEDFLRRSMALYGFPKPVRNYRRGKALLHTWMKHEVDQWLHSHGRNFV